HLAPPLRLEYLPPRPPLRVDELLVLDVGASIAHQLGRRGDEEELGAGHRRNRAPREKALPTAGTARYRDKEPRLDGVNALRVRARHLPWRARECGRAPSCRSWRTAPCRASPS